MNKLQWDEEISKGEFLFFITKFSQDCDINFCKHLVKMYSNYICFIKKNFTLYTESKTRKPKEY